MLKRQIPRWSDVRPLLGTREFTWSARQRRLAGAASILDLREIAFRRTPRSVFDYTDGAAEGEVSLARARQAFGRVEFHPRVLRDVADVDTTTTVLGQNSRLPLVFAPTGFTRMMQHEGEPAVARVAGAGGIPYVLSTLGTTSIETVRQAAPEADLWFQLYVRRDRSLSETLLASARAAGYRTLMLTVDTPVGGARMRDVRNGLTIPPTLRAKTLADMAMHPAWWANILTTEPLEFASLRSTGGNVSELIDRLFDPSVTFEDVSALREQWDGALVIKGLQRVDDARRAVDAGADGVVLSNHGGRQLDRAVTPLELLPDVVEAVGDRADVYIDTGVLHGADIVAAVALGATAVLTGRAYLYGLMAGGQPGVQRAYDILADEITRTLQLLGVRSVRELSADFVSLRPATHP